MGNMAIILKLAPLILIDILRKAPPDEATLPPEPIYAENVDNIIAQSERYRRIRNE